MVWHAAQAPEAMRGCGGILLSPAGRRFCDELGTRDYVTARLQVRHSSYPLAHYTSTDFGAEAFFVSATLTCKTGMCDYIAARLRARCVCKQSNSVYRCAVQSGEAAVSCAAASDKQRLHTYV
jgi:hypothetical protein